MLHEILLALSGHPSPLFETSPRQGQGVHASDDDFPLLSPSEKALLQTIGKLSELHRSLRAHLTLIAAEHPSLICRAVATSIGQTHLTRFQQKILDVESQILSKDAKLVGAYNIVPLAGVVGEFDDWHRRMAWFWELACFMQPSNERDRPVDSKQACTGVSLVDKLRAESSTGFPEIASAAVELSKVAETVWLRQLASWTSYGKLPSHGANDFFIRPEEFAESGKETFKIESNLLPSFVSRSTASSTLFIGRSLHQIRTHKKQRRTPTQIVDAVNEDKLAETHVQHLSSLTLPLVPAQFSRTISTIRLLLSQNALQHLLPVQTTLQALACLRQYFLLACGEFTMALIDQAEQTLETRQQNMGCLLRQDPIKALEGLSIKDAELHQTLLQTWKALGRQDENDEDDTLEHARRHAFLAPARQDPFRPSIADAFDEVLSQASHVAFNDFLFPSATRLDLLIEPPLNLFITARDIEAYSIINNYLLAIRRAEIRLSELWRRSAARRVYPSHTGKDTTSVATARNKAMRRVWATCSAALFLVSETAAYFEGEVVKSSCDHFEDWVKAPATEANEVAKQDLNSNAPSKTAHRDPEALSSAHRCLLASLLHALLLTDVSFTRDLRSLLRNVDVLVAYFHRLIDLHVNLNLENDAGQTGTLTTEDEGKTSLELDRARKKVDSDLRAVVHRLKLVNQERVGPARFMDLGSVAETGGFELWKGGGADRLLMKLEFGRMVDVGQYEPIL